ncbi:MAG: ribosome-associated translation inhibitor RaiA [Candidatus Hydrogenedens sp.]|nr:ribosome-associated translation inhibitor RaiA [Candidatus Hydrogenedens sp.]
MNLRISGRHIEVTPALRDHMEAGLGKLASHFDKVIDAEVVLDVEKHRHIAEVNLHANGIRIHSKESSLDMYASMDAVLHKLEKQCLKYKARINRHQPRSAKELAQYNHVSITPVSGNGHDHHEDLPAHREIERKTLSMKPMSVDEAVLQLELTEDLFLVFSNAETSQVNVIYKSHDGSFGLIEPQF